MEIPRNLRHPIFILSCVLFLSHQLIQKGFDVHIPFVHSYLDDLLVMPVILTLILVERRKFYGWGEDFIFSAPVTASLVLVFSLIFELIFPYFSAKFTFDWWDFVVYAIGGFIFYRYLNV
jgi:hypothetical protein